MSQDSPTHPVLRTDGGWTRKINSVRQGRSKLTTTMGLILFVFLTSEKHPETIVTQWMGVIAGNQGSDWNDELITNDGLTKGLFLFGQCIFAQKSGSCRGCGGSCELFCILCDESDDLTSGNLFYLLRIIIYRFVYLVLVSFVWSPNAILCAGRVMSLMSVSCLCRKCATRRTSETNWRYSQTSMLIAFRTVRRTLKQKNQSRSSYCAVR